MISQMERESEKLRNRFRIDADSWSRERDERLHKLQEKHKKRAKTNTTNMKMDDNINSLSSRKRKIIRRKTNEKSKISRSTMRPSSTNTCC